MWDKVKSRYRQIREGLTVITNKELVNGDVTIPTGTGGKIVHAQNQVEADIWFYDDWQYKKCLNIETGFDKPTQFRGIVLTVKGGDFAINYIADEHEEMLFDAEKLEGVPYLDVKELPSYEGLYYKDNEKIREYRLADIIDRIEKEFSVFVNKLETREPTDEDNADFDYVLTDNSIELFEIEKQKILKPFIRGTGMYYDFLGGLIDN